MSVLKVGYSAPDIKQFVQEPVTVEFGSPIRFTDSTGALQTSLGSGGTNVGFTTSGLAIADGGSWRLFANGANGLVRFWGYL